MEALKTFFVDLFSRSVSELSGLHFIILALITVLFFVLAKCILKCIWTALKAICRGIKNLCSTKKRCEKIQCPHCGRSLDKCVCQCNRGHGNTHRLYGYYKEERMLKREARHRDN